MSKLAIFLLLGGVLPASGCFGPSELLVARQGSSDSEPKAGSDRSGAGHSDNAPRNPAFPPPDATYDTFIGERISHILPVAGAPARTVYVAPPQGSHRGTGTRDDPLRDVIAAVRDARAGDRIYLQPGNYPMNEIRDLWGHTTSVLLTQQSGTPGNPIIFATDPEALDSKNDRVAVLDFQYGNQNGGDRSTCFQMSHDFWIVENLEMKNIWSRGIVLRGFDNIIRNNHLHHLDTTGTNNQALIVVMSSGRQTNNFIIRNHMHHVGEIDESTGVLTSYGGGNGGCFYTETRQSYDSTFRSLVGAASVEEIKSGVLPPDSHVYLYNNEVHHCRVGLNTKNSGEGPYFFLANIVHNVSMGIKTAMSHSVIRDNIIFDGPDAEGGTGIQIGQPSGGDNYLDATQNGVNTEVSHNTVVGFNWGLSYYGGWNSISRNNLVVGGNENVHVHRHEYFWIDGGAYPGLRGEYLLGDLNASHPYAGTFFSSLPPVMYQLGYQSLKMMNNAYARPPVIGFYGSVNNSDLEGRIFDTDYRVLGPEEISGLFRDAAAGDYRKKPGVLPEYGSRLE